MRQLILILALALLVSGAGAIKWGDIEMRDGAGIIFSGTAPGTTTNALYSDAGTLKFNGGSIGGSGSVLPTTNIKYSGTDIIASWAQNGTVIDTADSTNTTEVYTALLTAASKGGICEIGPGTYNIGANVLNLTYPVTLIGAIRPNTVIAGTGTEVIRAFSTSYIQYPRIWRLTVSGSGSAGIDGINLTRVVWSEALSDVAIKDCDDGLILQECIGNSFWMPRITNCTGEGIWLRNPSLASTYNQGNNANRFYGGTIDTITKSGINVSGWQLGNIFSGMTVELTGDPMIVLYATSTDQRPCANTFQGIWLEDDGTSHVKFKFAGKNYLSAPRANIVKGNYILMNTNHTIIDMDYGKGNIIRENMCVRLAESTATATIDLGADTSYNIVKENVGYGTIYTVTDAGTGNSKEDNAAV